MEPSRQAIKAKGASTSTCMLEMARWATVEVIVDERREDVGSDVSDVDSE